MMRYFAIQLQFVCAAAACLSLVFSGCATIRKFNPIESHLIASRQLTQQAQEDIYQGRWDEAESNLLTAIERCPDDDNARGCLADVLWQRGATSAAIEQLSKSIELSNRQDPAALTKLGGMELSVGDLQDALRHADAALDSDPKFAPAWSLRGRILKQSGDQAAALACFYRSLSIRNDDPQSRIEIAEIYRQRGQPQRALAILEADTSPGPDGHTWQPKISYLRGLALRALDRPQDAVRALTLAREQGSASPDLLFQLADAHLAVGELAQARSTAQQALAGTDGEQPAVRELLERIELAQRQRSTGMWR